MNKSDLSNESLNGDSTDQSKAWEVSLNLHVNILWESPTQLDQLTTI